MDAEELEQCRAMLGVKAGASLDDLERALMMRNFTLIKGRTGSAGDALPPEIEAQKQQLRAAYEKLAAHTRAEIEAELAKRKRPVLPAAHAPKPPVPPKTLLTPPEVKPRDPADDVFFLFRFGDWKVDTFIPPLLLGLVWLLGLTFLAPMRQGPTICVHEFGHATAAWLAGWRATPLPWGWTPVEPVHSNPVYFGLLFLLGLLLVAGVRERKIWPVLIAITLAGLQYYMTWRMPEKGKDFWVVFGGVGGEFVLSTLLMLAFWLRLPDKFKWGAVRYLFFLIGAAAFLAIWQRWQEIYPGREEIPFGSMINGEEDGNGDMNRLMDDYGWTKFRIRRTYWLLGWWCWGALGITWLVFALRLNKVGEWAVGKFLKTEEGAG